jgi:beta-barrel assembly-enhancing protease
VQSDWHGAYLDGQSATRIPAVVRVMQSGLEIILKDGPILWWPYNEIRQTQGFYAGEQVRLERGRPISETLIVDDSAFLTALHQRQPEAVGRFHDPATRPLRTRLVVYAAVGVVVGSVALYLWGIPAMAAIVAPHVPVSWEEHLGREVMMKLAPDSLRCRDPQRSKVLDGMIDQLLAPQPSQPYSIRVTVVNHPSVNAFAAPGGYVVVFRGLLEKTETAEELAGVLAHEIQHVLQRHTTQQLLEQASTGILIAAMTGDATGAAAFGLKSAKAMGMMRYSRHHEAEADLNGARMLIAAGINPHGMVSFFEKMRDEPGMELPDFLEYVSTHPPTQERIDALTAYLQTQTLPSDKLVPDDTWATIKNSCIGTIDTTAASESP